MDDHPRRINTCFSGTVGVWLRKQIVLSPAPVYGNLRMSVNSYEDDSKEAPTSFSVCLSLCVKYVRLPDLPSFLILDT